jgi:hypothetical protein
MRRHMQGMRGRRRDRCVSPGGVEPAWRESRCVVQIDQIMRDARVPRLAADDRFEDGRAFELLGIVLSLGDAATLSVRA